MALSGQNQNLISELQGWAEAELAQRDRAKNILMRWNQNGVFDALTDVDVTAIFPHLDKSEVANGINALTAVVTALGDDSSGQATNLAKLKG